MLIASNRCLNLDRVIDGQGNEDAFGDIRDEKLRFAEGMRQADGWRVALIDEKTFQKTATAGSRNCVVYLHGFNKPFRDALSDAAKIEEFYGVDVILFSWPSLIPDEFDRKQAYIKARTIAEASSAELGPCLQLCGQIGSSLGDQQRSLNLLAHSLGNYLLQKHLERCAGEECKVGGLTNVVLSQADVDSDDHYRWVRTLRVAGGSVFVTINTRDKKLAEAAEVLSSRRLGNTSPPDVQPEITYVDFTEGEGVNSLHALWRDAVANAAAKGFFTAVFNGRRFPELADPQWFCKVLTLSPSAPL